MEIDGDEGRLLGLLVPRLLGMLLGTNSLDGADGEGGIGAAVVAGITA
jgi:hypothetical protein